jgi:hypothetical protein
MCARNDVADRLRGGPRPLKLIVFEPPLDQNREAKVERSLFVMSKKIPLKNFKDLVVLHRLIIGPRMTAYAHWDPHIIRSLHKVLYSRNRGPT